MPYMTPGTSGTINDDAPKPQPQPQPPKMRGLGDLVHWVFAKFGVEVAVKKITKVKDCGCQARQEALNRAIPFYKEEDNG